ncbi:hypothetical protein [Bizionia argentinensis]|uniref:hypothetical protein n=1 Tax=Bizionia argentinensis TaxID=456455 RepID=UPI000222FFAD|nr:hypothetical protein [Bizionia argentinensis]
MKKIVLISTILLILSCENKTTEIRYYPTDREILNEKMEIIGLDTTTLNFRQITNKIGNDYYPEPNFKEIALEFYDGQIKKTVIPYVYSGGLIKQKNVLVITSDSILIDNGYRIDELKRILKRHYQNNGEIPNYPVSSHKALIEVNIDSTKTGLEIKEILTKLTHSFDEIKSEINDSTELRVLFDYYRNVPPPPPPPKTENEFDNE